MNESVRRAVEWVRKQVLVAVLWVSGALLAVGALWIALASSTEKHSVWFELHATVGATLIATGIVAALSAFLIPAFDERISRWLIEVSVRGGLVQKTRSSGIRSVFVSRREDRDYLKELDKKLKECPHDATVLMRGNSLRDFFHNSHNKDILPTIRGMIMDGIKFDLLLLDPTSDAAKARAVVEEGDGAKGANYHQSQLYVDIFRVSSNLWSPDVFASGDEGFSARFRSQVTAHFVPFDMGHYGVITPDAAFVEFYHSGGAPKVAEYVRRHQPVRNPIDCLGGFVPVFMLHGKSTWTGFLRSDFDRTKKHPEVANRPLEIIIQRLREAR